MKVIWHQQAIEGREQIAEYIREYFGAMSKARFLQEVRRIIRMLKLSPNIGSIDPLFANRSIAYRSIIINGLSKLIYFVEGDTVYIADFWDVRREPEALAAQVKGKIR